MFKTMILLFYVKVSIVLILLEGHRFQAGRFKRGSSFDFWSNESFIDLPAHGLNVSQDGGILREYCPRNYCGVDSLDDTIVNDTTMDLACCEPCDCSDRCFELVNCCYDKEYYGLPESDSWEGIREVCTETTIVNEARYPDEVRLSYLLYQHCGNSDNASLIDKCYNPDGESMTDLLPVYSSRTGRQYRNKYCALCNGEVVEEELTNWNQELRCRSNFDMFIGVLNFQHNETDRNAAIISKMRTGTYPCGLYFTPPEGTLVTKCLLRRNMISNCHSSSPEYYRLEEKCKTYHSPVYSFAIIYKNVFCMMCNEQLNPFASSYCSLDTFDLSIKSMYETAFLNLDETFSPGLDDQIMDHHNRCTPPTTVFNDEINECLTMRCPLADLPVGGMCSTPIRSLSNMNFDFRVDVKYPKSAMFDNDAILNEVTTLFAHVPHVVVCKSIRTLRLVDKVYVAHVQMLIHIPEPINLKKTFMDFVTNIRDYNNVTSGIYEMDVGKDVLMMLIPDIVNLFPYQSQLGTTCEGIAMSDMLFCPMVAFAMCTYREADKIDISGILFEPHEYVISSSITGLREVYVCLDTYIAKYKAKYQPNAYIQSLNGSGSEHAAAVFKSVGLILIVYVLPRHN